MVKIVPNITTVDISEGQKKLLILNKLVDWVHIDIIDDKFSTTPTFTFKDLTKIKIPKRLNTIIHFSTHDPTKQIGLAKSIGVKMVIAQIEAIKNQEKFINKNKKNKIKVGFSLDKGTGILAIKKKLLSKLDIILVMTIKTGWIGRPFIFTRLAIVKQLKRLKEKNNYRYLIAADGGINKKNIKDCVCAGAEMIFLHSVFWQNKDLKKGLQALYKVAKS